SFTALLHGKQYAWYERQLSMPSGFPTPLSSGHLWRVLPYSALQRVSSPSGRSAAPPSRRGITMGWYTSHECQIFRHIRTLALETHREIASNTIPMIFLRIVREAQQ